MRASASTVSETRKRALFERRILVIHILFGLIVLVIVGRLIELQVIRGGTYRLNAEKQQYGNVVLSARRGEILSRSSRNGETSILATNTTLELLYVDPSILKTGHAALADTLADILVTDGFDRLCRTGSSSCPTELAPLYEQSFDPLHGITVREIPTGSGGYTVVFDTGSTLQYEMHLPDITEIRRRFARSTEQKILKQTVTFVPLLYGANKKQVADILQEGIPGVTANADESLIYANPDLVDQRSLSSIARRIAPILSMDPETVRSRLIRRKLRYVPIMGKLPPELSEKIKALPDERAIALIPEHWRFYPDTTIASHVVGFINAIKEPQYGVERAFDSILRGQEGLITSINDLSGRQIVSTDQKFVDPKDGATIVLTIDRLIQANVEKLLQAMVEKVDAESGQVIVMDPKTGRILALANAPLFDSNTYAGVYEKVPIAIDSEREKTIVAEVFNPESNARILRAYLPDLTLEGRKRLSAETQQKLMSLESLYDIRSLTRYYYYLGDNNRREIFPTDQRGVWLKYKNNIGVGSYVNRAVQEMYEPGSVIKPLTMAVAIDQGEVSPLDIYNDTGAVKVDIFTIKNALNKYYGRVTMIDCIDFSINTCMTRVSGKLGRRLFRAALEQFGFGRITGIELDNELPGELRPIRDWNEALLMTASFGQGISATPIQVAVALGSIANNGKLLRPMIIDEVRSADGTVTKKQPEILRQVMKPETAATMTAILTHGADVGFAKAGKVRGHRIAGKTGTSQIAGPGGKYEQGTGSTIASYVGFAPVDAPKFLVLVKLDRPKKDDFGSKSAAPLFRDIASFLFRYYDIPSDEK